MERASFDYEGHKITYFYKKGSRGNVVLMHGYSFNSKVWEEIEMVERLGAFGYNIFCIDVPGFPKSVNRESLGDEEMVGFLEAFIRKLKGDVVLLGSSASGYIALKFAEKHSNMIAGLVVVAPVGLEKVDLHRITTKVLGIWGSRDDVSPVRKNSETLKTINGADIEILEGAGHACYLDKPWDFIDMVSNFIKKILVVI